MRFILIDEIRSVVKGKRIMGVKNVSMSEDWFRDHFPGRPIMPGVLLIETIAQTGAILIDVTTGYSTQAVMTAVEGAKFMKPVQPADQLSVDVELLQMSDVSAKVSGQIMRNGEKIAQAVVLYVLRNGNDSAAQYWTMVSKHLTSRSTIVEG